MSFTSTTQSHDRHDEGAAGAHISAAPASDLWWIFRDGWSLLKWKIVAVIVLNLVGTAAGVAAIGGIVLYARTLESQHPVKLGPLSIDLPAQTSDVLRLSATLALIGIFSALCVYAGNWLTGKISVLYLRHCVQRALMLGSDPLCAGAALLTMRGRPDTIMLQLTGRHARAAAVIFRRLLLVMLPLIVFVVALTSLIMVSPLLTALLVPLGILYIVPLRRITRSVVDHQNELLKATSSLRNAVRSALARLRESSQRERVIEQCVTGTEMQRAEFRLFRRRLAADRMHFVNTALFIVCVFVLFGYFAIQAIDHGHSWSELLMYVLALRFAATELRRVTASVVLTNRYVPHARSFRRFMDECGRIAVQRTAVRERRHSPPDKITIQLSKPPKWNAAASLVWRSGEVLAVITDQRPHHAGLQATAIILERYAHFPVDVAQPPMMDQDHREPECAAGAAASAGASATLTRAASAAERHSINAALLTSAPQLRAADPDAVERWLSATSDGRFLAIAVRDVRVLLHDDLAPLRHRVSGALIITNGEIIAAGDMQWLLQHAEQIRQALNATDRRADDENMNDADEDEDEDEEEC